jgi:predicted RNase H-like HicB family nuclease
MSTGREIRLIENGDGVWSAIDEETGVASQGSTREAALSNLDEAVELHETGGGPIEDEDAFLEEIGIDPEEVPDEPNEQPEFMR